MHTTTAVHGVSVCVERPAGALLDVGKIPGSEMVGAPFGWGREFKAHAGTRLWFHAAPPLGAYSPTPTDADPFWQSSLGILRIRLQLSCEAEQTAVVDDVHLYDGHRRFWTKHFTDARGI